VGRDSSEVEDASRASRAPAQKPTSPRARAARSTKVVPPAPAGPILPRIALQKRLDEAMRRRLTLVVAEAGYGKSTLLAAWADGVNSAWYTVTAEDVALASLVRGIVGTLRLHVPRLPLEIDAAVNATRGPDAVVDELARAEACAAVVCDALQDQLTRELVLVLDDAQELRDAAGAWRLIEALARHAPAAFHVVLSSRSEPPFSVDRLRGRGQLFELAGADLAFSGSEIGELVSRSLGEGGGDATTMLRETTGGWPAAVRLAIEAVAAVPAGSERRRTLVQLRRPGGALYAYLAEEVFAREERDVRELLRHVAPLDRFTTELCAAIGLRNPGRVIARLRERGLFVEERDEWMKLHTLARDFVLSTWPLAEEEARSLHRDAASWFGSHGQLEDALPSLAAVSDHRAIARLLSQHSGVMVAAGAGETIIRFAELVPPSSRGPALEQALGTAYAVRGELDRALECFRRATRDAELLPAALAWRIVETHQLRDELDDAVNVYEQTRLDGADLRDEALLVAAMASVRMRRGETGLAEALARRALDAATACEDDAALAAAHTAVASVMQATGDTRGSEIHLRLALAAAHRSGDLLQLARIHNNSGSRLLEEGSYEAAVAELEEGMRVAEVAGFPGLLALTLMNRGLCNWCLGRLDEASADYEAAVAIYRRTGTREIAYALIGRGDVYRERGDLALARAAYEEGLAVAARSGDLQGIVPGLYQLAKVLVDDDPDEAVRLAERAVAYGWPDHAWALNAAGWIALARGDRERAAALAVEAATAARGRSDRFGLAESLELVALSASEPAAEVDRLEEAFSIWEELGNPLRAAGVALALARLSTGVESRRSAERAEQTLRARGVRISPTGAAGLLRAVAGTRDAAVEIETLGGFRVLRAGKPVALAEWQSKKARDLLKILVARRGRPTPREFLMEALWPGEDPAKLANRLSVALSTVRTILDPERRFGMEQFVVADTSAVALNIPSVAVDVERFLADASAALALRRDAGAEAMERLALAEAAYGGEFLEEDAYADWAVPLREEARAVYVSVARALAEEGHSARDYDSALRYLLRILERDAYDEPAHLSRVAALAAGGRHGEARRAFRAYCARMDEVGVEPTAFPTPA
jgi:DNA-binding SARP family transcriptional activator